MSDSQHITLTAALNPTPARRWEAALITAGTLAGHNLRVAPEVIQQATPQIASKACFANHPGMFETRDVASLIGTFEEPYFDPQSGSLIAELQAWDTPAAQWASKLIDQLIAAEANGTPAPDVGLSLDCWITTTPPDEHGIADVTTITNIESADLVYQPASDGARFRRILAQRGEALAQRGTEQEACPATLRAPDRSRSGCSEAEQSEGESQTMTAEQNEVQAEAHATLAEARRLLATARVASAGLPAPLADGILRRVASGADVEAEIADARATLTALTPNVVQGFGRPIDAASGVLSAMTDPLDIARNAVRWLFGVKSAKLPPPDLRTPSNLYHALTGDHEWRGRFSAEHARFARASTTTLADLATDAMNIIIAEQWEALGAYRWFEPLVTVAPHDGSLNSMNWVSFGGIANLPSVAEGATYTELNVADGKETDSFVKYGGYVGITDEMFRKNQMLKIQAIPRALAAAAVRTRSYYISYIFTQASGTGPTLDDDSTVLFHTDHANHATTALSIAAWAAARTAMFEQTQLGSSKALGIFPKFILVPIELYDSALVIFGYGQGMGGYPGTANNDVNPYAESRAGDPRPTVVCVPEWTDATNWYYLADPNVQPVLFMSYAQQPGGGSHPMPELFTVTDPAGGLIFTNDVLPIKVRDWFAYGVATWRGIGGRVVAG